MNLPDYIKSIGEAQAATLFRASLSTVKSWRYGQRSPRPEKANEIVRATGGAVTLAGIYSHKNADDH